MSRERGQRQYIHTGGRRDEVRENLKVEWLLLQYFRRVTTRSQCTTLGSQVLLVPG